MKRLLVLKTVIPTMLIVVALLALAGSGPVQHYSVKSKPDHSTTAVSVRSDSSYSGFSSNQWENRALSYAFNHWGKSAVNNKLDALEYASNINFINWYHLNYYTMPSGHRNLTKSNLSLIINTYELNDPLGNHLASLVTQFEMNTQIGNDPVNTAQIVANNEGKLVSNSSMTYKGEQAYLLIYKYQGQNFTVTYELIKHGNQLTPVDPTIRLNEFTIYKGWWIFTISAKSYNIYTDFYNYNNALQFENFISTGLTITAIVQDILTLVVYAVIGYLVGPTLSAGQTAIAGVASGLISDLLGTTNPMDIAGNVNTLFKNEEGELGYFRLVFTLNQWSWGIVPEFAVWGRINPGNSLFEVFRNVQPLTGGDIVNAYIDTWYAMESAIGINDKVYLPNPSGGWGQFVV